MMNTINWSSFERAGFGSYKKAALSWMFRHGKIFWEYLLVASVKRIFFRYGIKEGILVLDELDRARCKVTKRIHKTYKQKDKKTGGYVNGQTVVLLLLVTDSITFPVGFKFYMPDPVQTAWKKEDEKLRRKGVPKKKRPVSPEPDPEYPTKQGLALELLKQPTKHI
ncbi:MAG: transposase, partial [Candidatus Electrothrix sp. AUS4]|nr:transposase [Candidatus Electrothrix sp. AUS4]